MATFDGSDLDAEQTPIFDRMDKEYKIYVDNLPSELKEDAIRQVFNPYGQITGMFYCPNSTWAFIMYGSYREAECAIRELHNKKPLYLKVALAKEKAVKKDLERLRTETVEKVSLEKHEPVLVQNIKHTPRSIGRGCAIRKCIAMPDMIAPHERAQSFSSLSPMSSGYEINDPYMNTNRLWTRGVLTVTADGKRHVSLGRGYSVYEIPEPDSKCEEYITQVYELRKNGLYEYGNDTFKDELQRCIVCSTKTTKHCEKCHTYYCSKACQVTHWPRHQVECERIPDLVDESSLEQVIEYKATKPQDSNTPRVQINTFNDVKLRRPNTPVQVQGLSTNVQRTNCTSQINEDTKTINQITDKCPDNRPNNRPNCRSDNRFDNQLDNKSNVLKKMTTDQPTENTTNNRTMQNRLNRYANENTDQTKRNDQFSTTVNKTRENHYTHGYKNDSTNKTYYDNETDKNDHVKDKFSNNVGSHPHQRDGFQNDRKLPYNQRETTNNKQEQKTSVSIAATDESLDFRKDTYLSKTNFKDVEIIIPLDNNEYWIYKVEDMNARNDLMMKLQDVGKNFHNVLPVIGDVYGVLHETIWHRAMIISLNPLKVHFIDSGKDETLETNTEIRDIQNLANIPRFARKIRVQTTNMKYKNFLHGDKISVKMLSMDTEKTMAVEVEERSDDSTARTVKNLPQSSNTSNSTIKAPQEKSLLKAENTSTTRLCNIINTLANLLTENGASEICIMGVIQIFERAQNIYYATLVPEDFTNGMEKLINDLPEACIKMAKTTEALNYKPQMGDLVCGEIESGIWYRGYVTSLSPLRLAVVDEARITSAIRVLPYPKEFLNICTYGVTCEVNNVELQMGGMYTFSGVVKEQNKNNLKIKMCSQDEKDSQPIEAMIKLWRPSKAVPAFAELRNGCKIYLTNYRNQYIMFAHSRDESEIEYIANITQRVAHFAQTAPRLSEPPSTQQMVIAPYELDGNKYRAIITKIHEGNKATIVYVDFGNFTDININELQEIPDDLAVKRSCSARLMLKDVPRDLPMTAEVDAYLRDLVGTEETLLCTYDDESFKNGVYLTTSTGENVNDKIKKLLIPSWKKDNYDDKTCYMLNDIDLAPLGKVGDTVEVLALYQSYDDKLTYMMGPSDNELINHIVSQMPELLQEYCEKNQYYIPRKQELCLALYDGAWYRALCLDPKLSQTTCEIFFVDYGNKESVEHQNVRQMPETFIRPAAMANMCTVINLAPVDSAGDYSAAVKKRVEELVQLNTMVTIKIVEFTDSYEYKIELPSVRETLEREGLVSSSF